MWKVERKANWEQEWRDSPCHRESFETASQARVAAVDARYKSNIYDYRAVRVASDAA